MKKANRASVLSRRQVLATGLTVGSAAVLATRARGQSRRNVKLTLPWLAGGSNYWPILGKGLGLYAARGINLDVARGFGSSAAALAVANKQFDFGVVFAGPAIVAASREQPLVALGTFYYDANMGIVLRADSLIRTPKDLEGKRIGIAPADAVAPFWPAFVRSTGIDGSKVSLVQVDPKLIERTLIDKQVDGITGVSNANIPVMVSLNEPARFMFWSPYGIRLYAAQLVTRRDMIERDPQLCQDVCDATFEAVAHSLREPEESIDVLAHAVPEIALTKGARENARLAQGLTQGAMIAPEAIEHGLGWSDLDKYPKMVDLVMTYAAPKDAVRPDPASLVTNQFVGRMKLTAQGWDKAKAYAASFSKYIE